MRRRAERVRHARLGPSASAYPHQHRRAGGCAGLFALGGGKKPFSRIRHMTRRIAATSWPLPRPRGSLAAP
jgi:hypothetical protein